MLKLLQSLFGEPATETAAGGRAATVKVRTASQSTAVGGDYRAVSLSPARGCVAAATGATRRRYLLRDAPRLPLTGCSLSGQCTCKFRKHADRRDDERRMFGTATVGTWYAGTERRSARCRRRSRSR